VKCFEEIATAVTANVLCVVGTAGGTGVGALVGSFAPGLGTLIGACVGAFVGGLFGYLLGRFGGKYCINALLRGICPKKMRAAQNKELYSRALAAYCLTKDSSRSHVVSTKPTGQTVSRRPRTLCAGYRRVHGRDG